MSNTAADNTFSTDDVAAYYNQTLIHYKQWWKLDEHLSLHYGIWDENTKSFADSLVNTNRVLAELAQIKTGDKVLDAGCGVGGAAFFLASTYGAEVTGISLSEKQINYANETAKTHPAGKSVSFQIADYTQTPFDDASFDVVWACESSSSAVDKKAFIKEAYRVLKPGGRLILSDFFIPFEGQDDPKQYMKKWGATWGITDFVSHDFFSEACFDEGFTVSEMLDRTDQIQKSAKRMYNAYWLGVLPSKLYNLTHPKVSKFAKTHYLCGYYQYKALQLGLWNYKVILAHKIGT